MSNLPKARTRLIMEIATGAVVASIVVFAGCSDDKSNGSNSDPRFDPATVTIVVGDTIRFVAVSGDHTVTSGTGSDDPATGQLFDADLPEGDTITRVFNIAGLVSYYCIPHEADGMTGTVTVAAVSAKTVEVFASGTAFNPSIIEINPGDQVRWTVSGSHTITSGIDLSDPLAGDLFDAVRNTGQTFTHTFNDLGSFTYFCRIHVSMGMTGTVNVVARTNRTIEVEALE